jgi:hypothetical protein
LLATRVLPTAITHAVKRHTFRPNSIPENNRYRLPCAKRAESSTTHSASKPYSLLADGDSSPAWQARPSQRKILPASRTASTLG